jgi:hypothetical protein
MQPQASSTRAFVRRSLATVTPLMLAFGLLMSTASSTLAAGTTGRPLPTHKYLPTSSDFHLGRLQTKQITLYCTPGTTVTTDYYDNDIWHHQLAQLDAHKSVTYTPTAGGLGFRYVTLMLTNWSLWDAHDGRISIFCK